MNVMHMHCWHTLAFLCLMPVLGIAQPGHNFWNKTNPELIKLMSSGDEGVRSSAARFLGMRYQNPMALSVHEAFYDARKIAPLDENVPSIVVPQLCKSMQTDAAVSVRLAALRSLEDISHRTNTTSCIISGLTNSMTLVRLEACEALIKKTDESGAKWPDQIVPTLAECLNSNGKPDEIYLVVYTVGCLGNRAEPLVPHLQELKMYSSKRVQNAVIEALNKIQRSSTSANHY